MGDNLLFAANHLSEGSLISLQDGELAASEAERAQEHLQACWECRLRAERCSQAVLRFVEYSNAVVEACGGFPDTRHEFRTRLRERTVTDPPPQPGRFWTMSLDRLVPQPRVATAGIALVVVLWWTFFGSTVPVASAEELVGRSVQMESLNLQKRRHSIVHQRLELASGVERVEWDFWHEPRRQRSRGRWSHTTPLTKEFAQLYAKYGWNNRQPLSAAVFSEWRQSLRNRADEVVQGGDGQLISVQTRAAHLTAPGRIREARITMRAADMRVVEQQFVVNGGKADREYRIRELSFSVIAPEQVPPGVFAEPPGAPKLRPLTPVSLPRNELDTAEVAVRAALHEMQLDTRLIPEFVRGPQKLTVRLVAETRDQEERIAVALSGIRHVESRIINLDSSVEQHSVPLIETRPPAGFRTNPPLNQALTDYFGSFDLTNDYVGQVHSQFRVLIADALALERLTARYTEAESAKLPSGSRAAVDRIARDHLDAIAENWSVASGLLGPVFDEMHRRQGLDMTKAAAVESAPVVWRDAATRLAGELRQLESAFNLLFVSREQPASIEIETNATLQRAEQLHRIIDSVTRGI